ncbi:MAG: DUF2207 domain-containing protein [Clostridia bacterium]|nr:DUF2207 domain-containing protein [Clostridia bacterium]
MKKILKRTILFICIFIGILIISNNSNASGGLRLRNLSYDVTLNADGTADVTETWKIRIEDTNTLFKTFEVDSSKYKEITNVKVKEIKSSGDIDFTKINQYKYHVDKKCYYALMYKGNFEIAWGAHAESTTRTYKISYKIIDAIKNYNDCSEFYWQFISRSSEIPADYIEGTIKLPTSVQNLEDLRVWAHGPLNGNIEKLSNNTVRFTVEDFAENTMLETRIVTPTTIFNKNLNTVNQNKLSSILSEEQTWADQANRKREQIAKQIETRRKVIITFFIVTNILGLILAVVVIRKIIKYHRELKNTPIIKPNQQFEYYRDVDKNQTPAEAGFLYYFKSTGLQYNMTKIVSATMLDLCMKKHISFEQIPGKKDQIKVNLISKNTEELKEDEKLIYELLKKVPKNDSNSFTMKEFEKYASNHSSEVLSKFKRIETIAKKSQEQEGNYSKELITKHYGWSFKGALYIFLTIASIAFMWLLVIPSAVASIYCFKISGRYNTLTEKGMSEKEKLKGLKKYMEDFSMMKEKSVPELILWEKYLVYATVFGIADKVLKQLKVVYPEMLDESYLSSNGYTYLYLMNSSRFSTSFISTLNNSVRNSYYSSTNYSSGSGGGGGFSSGGGFGGGGGRNGRKISLLHKRNEFKY